MTEKRVQKSGDGSLNIQAEKVSVTAGLTYSEVRDIALDVFEQNFHTLAGIAADTARKRAEEITDNFIIALKSRNPERVQASTDPDFQYSLFTAQLEYAKAGDKQLGDVLVDLLVDRSREQKRSLLSIVLNESIKVAPQLIPEQIAVLSLVFTLRYTTYLPMRDEHSLKSYFEKRVNPYVLELPSSYSSIQHLEYSGCSTMSIGSRDIANALLETYPGLFSKGFGKDVLIPHTELNPQIEGFLVQCRADSTKFQFGFINHRELELKASTLKLDFGTIEALKTIEKGYRLGPQEAQAYIEGLDASFARAFQMWKELRLGHMSLTSVGIAIGHANVRRITGESAPLSIWIK